jgi:hypothetical protein
MALEAKQWLRWALLIGVALAGSMLTPPRVALGQTQQPAGDGQRAVVPGAATRANLVIFGGATYSDNVFRSGIDEQSGVAAVVGFEVLALKQAGRLTLEALGDLSFLRYLGSVSESDVNGGISGRGRYDLVPDRFAWTLEGSYTQLREEFLLAQSPGNRQSLTRLTTGPDIRQPLGGQTDLLAELRYARNDYESSNDFDYQSYLGRVALSRDLSSRSQLAIGGGFEKFDLGDQALNPGIDSDFDRREYFVRFNLSNARTTLRAELGRAEVDGIAFDESGPLVRINLTRAVTPTVTVALQAAREFTTTGERSGAFVGGETAQLDDDISRPAGEPFEQTRYGVSINYTRPRTQLSLLADRTKEDYVLGLQRRATQYAVRGQRRLTPQLDITAQVGRLEDELVGARYDIGETIFRSSLRWRLTRSFALSFGIDKRRRSGSQLAAGDYSEFSGQVVVRYSPWSPDVTTEDAVEGIMRR